MHSPVSLAPPRFRTIAVLAVTQLIAWGTTYEMPGVLGRIMARDIGVANELVYSGLTLMMLTAALLGPTVGRLLVSHGAAKVLAAGSLAFAAGLVLLAESRGIVVFLIAWGVIGVGGGLGLSTACYAAVVERQGVDARRTIGLLMVLTGLSAGIFWPILATLEQAIGWRHTCLVAALLNLAIGVPLNLFALPRPLVSGSPEALATTVPPLELSPRDQSIVFAVIAVVTTLCSFVTFGLSPSLLELFRQAGASGGLALQLGSARSVLGIMARFADAMVGARGTPVVTATAGLALILIALPFLAIARGETGLLVAFVVLYGFGAGITTVARSVLPLSFFSAGEYGWRASRLSLPQNLANALAPVIVTALLDRGGLGSVLAVITVLIVIALGGFLWLRRIEKTRRPGAVTAS
ncbi:MFS transporter [Methyloraptor flagellatus]|uniref:MFS transporter n=1 Tax=Methyloraptor flagellatus TaxID=3162530 RepID=A0AAU7X964_9HYPH